MFLIIYIFTSRVYTCSNILQRHMHVYTYIYIYTETYTSTAYANTLNS